ncbi:hypothetical protein PCH_Pc18g02650 [Penicillium rubens Wisconsin 54-1255]|uniref:Uncharacterized protein n=1 Tax=Penicillium rubens (strain ATCC 28089 / DSM 1075 / NRRL 1951 / Wisconsin 54-1255) TaxID=500485 RepID=B6HCY6_PENRW|nr:hypothetical protein PCH_Pc18g02650 [Penicillium rubens Wisconsin 54-1255]
MDLSEFESRFRSLAVDIRSSATGSTVSPGTRDEVGSVRVRLGCDLVTFGRLRVYIVFMGGIYALTDENLALDQRLEECTVCRRTAIYYRRQSELIGNSVEKSGNTCMSSNTLAAVESIIMTCVV